ncbi:MAG: nickel pincer cofactor biosynthesis protein LarC [Thaumarchaeota archaeon]|nr:nickel pincer cofactor biosynthesis protein LarC [Nitrososphaerota archaeon]NDF26036.1 nickel pincer cofactor biosynthesis protein LarC [Nitrosopumilaceae archaeon]
MVLVIDPQIAGISGDMLLSGLVDLGAKKSKIITGVKEAEKFLHHSKISKIDFKKVNKHGVNATSLVLKLDEHFHDRKGIEIQNCIAKTVAKIGLSDKAAKFAKDSIETLISAESKIHGVPKNLIHFHEAASVDTVIDIVGTAIALDDLKCFDQEIITMPVAVGNGTVSFSHGTVSNPAGAILGIFAKSGILISGNNSHSELATPTGAAMLVNLATRCVQHYPLMKVESVGYGAGQKNFEGFSNVLKLVQGEKSILESDIVSILETNVDDVSGEVLAHVIDKVMTSGAKDISVIPTMTKKGRPGHLVSVICSQKDIDRLANVLISETGTLGVRIRSSERFVMPRKIIPIKVKIQNSDFTVRCKTTGKSFKVEYDDIKKISEKLGSTFKQTEELIKAEVRKQLK